MFCPNCGKGIPDNTKFCPYCGRPASVSQQIYNSANNVFQNAEKHMSNAVHDVQQQFHGGNNGQYGPNNGQFGNNNAPHGGAPYGGAPYGGPRLTEDRSLLMYILLTLVTCGIYSYYFIYKMAQDVNTACEGDGETTSGLVAFIVLSLLTCGIYAWIWYYKLGNRLANNAGKYGLVFQENGTTVLMWLLFGSLLCGIGPFIAMNILINNTNRICIAYNRSHGL